MGTRDDIHQNGHLDLARLDAVRAGEGTPEEGAHCATCPLCRAVLGDWMLAADALKALDRPVSPEVPREVDKAILAAYREAFPGRAKVIPFPAWRRCAAPALGAAMAAALVVALVLPGSRSGAPAPGHPPLSAATAGDVNGDGVVDILDAYALARTIEARGKLIPAWDASGDGHIDQVDVETIAKRVVAL